MRKTRTTALRAGLATVTLLSTAACGGGSGSDEGTSAASQAAGPTAQSSTPAPAGTEAPSASAAAGGALPSALQGKQVNNHGTKPVAGQKKVDMELDDFYFQPTVLVGDPGQRLTVELENEGSAAHTFSLPSRNVDVVVDPGDRAEVTVTFPDNGSLAFECRFHAGQGMRGALVAGS